MSSGRAPGGQLWQVSRGPRVGWRQPSSLPMGCCAPGRWVWSVPAGGAGCSGWGMQAVCGSPSKWEAVERAAQISADMWPRPSARPARKILRNPDCGRARTATAMARTSTLFDIVLSEIVTGGEGMTRDLIRGSSDRSALILTSLADSPKHGYGARQGHRGVRRGKARRRDALRRPGYLGKGWPGRGAAGAGPQAALPDHPGGPGAARERLPRRPG